MSSKISIIFFTVFIDLLGFGIIIPILPNYAISLGANTLTTGMIVGCFSLMNFIMTSYLGAWSDKIGRRPVLLFTILMNAISYMLLAISNQLWLIFLSRIVAGIGSANISTAQAYIADVTVPSERTKKMGLIGMAFGLGFILGPAIGGYFKSIDAHQGLWYVGILTSLLCILNFIFVFFFLEESHTHRNDTLNVRLTPFQNIYHYLSMPVIKEYLWYLFIFMVAFSIFQVLSTVYWAQHCHLKDKEIGILFAFIGSVSILWQTWGLKMLLKKMNEYQIIILSSVCMSIAFILLIFLDADNIFPLAYMILFLISMGNGLITPCIYSLLSQRSPVQQTGRLLGVSQSLTSLSRVVGPMIGGFLYDIHFAYPFIFSSIILISSIFLMKNILMKNI